MQKPIQTKKNIVRAALWSIAIIALLLTMHILVNNFHLVEVIKAIHGG